YSYSNRFLWRDPRPGTQVEHEHLRGWLGHRRQGEQGVGQGGGHRYDAHRSHSVWGTIYVLSLLAPGVHLDHALLHVPSSPFPARVHVSWLPVYYTTPATDGLRSIP